MNTQATRTSLTDFLFELNTAMEASKVALIAFASLTAGAVISRSQHRKYKPDKVWKIPQPESENGNRATAGARREEKLKEGKHNLQLHSLGTPNGVKVTILLEELVDMYPDFEYDAYLINIMKGDQFGSEFVKVNPNSKIPVRFFFFFYIFFFCE